MAKKFKILIGQEQEITFLIKAEHEDKKIISNKMEEKHNSLQD